MTKKTTKKRASKSTRLRRDQSEVAPIVSSAHLATGDSLTLSEFEYALIMTSHAFNRWIVRCMAATGASNLSPLDVLVLHSINHRDRPKKLADLCLVLNLEDTHTVNYSLKKLEKLGLVKTSRIAGKEKVAEIEEEGRRVCDKYAAIRNDCLVRSFHAFGDASDNVVELASLLRVLSGLYDQAARSAASM